MKNTGLQVLRSSIQGSSKQGKADKDSKNERDRRHGTVGRGRLLGTASDRKIFLTGREVRRDADIVHTSITDVRIESYIALIHAFEPYSAPFPKVQNMIKPQQCTLLWS
jgi:hypothetical protein